MSTTTTKVRRSPARVNFMRNLAHRGCMSQCDGSGPLPSIQSIHEMKAAGLFTTRQIRPTVNKRGNRTTTTEFIITDAGRAWLRESEGPSHE